MRRLALLALLGLCLVGCAKPARSECFMALEASISITAASHLVMCMERNLDAYPPWDDAAAREHAELRTASANLATRTESLQQQFVTLSDDLDAADWDGLITSAQTLDDEVDTVRVRWFAFNERRRSLDEH